MMYLLVKTVAHDQRVGQGQSVWFHRMAFLAVFGENQAPSNINRMMHTP